MNSKCWDCSRNFAPLRLASTADVQRSPKALFACSQLLLLSPSALELHVIASLVTGWRLLWICSRCLSTQRGDCQKPVQTFTLSCLCTVGCGGCNLHWLQKSAVRLWFQWSPAAGWPLFDQKDFNSHIVHMENVCCFNCWVSPSFKQGHPPPQPQMNKAPPNTFSKSTCTQRIIDANTEAEKWILNECWVRPKCTRAPWALKSDANRHLTNLSWIFQSQTSLKQDYYYYYFVSWVMDKLWRETGAASMNFN